MLSAPPLVFLDITTYWLCLTSPVPYKHAESEAISSVCLITITVEPIAVPFIKRMLQNKFMDNDETRKIF